MVYVSNLAKRWPMLSTAVGVVFTFCWTAPLVWIISNLLVESVRAFGR